MVEAWRIVIRSHPALRTAFVQVGECEYAQVTHDTAEPTLEELQPDLATNQSVQEVTGSELLQPLELDAAPVMRLKIIHQPQSEEWRIVWMVSPALLDECSIAIVLRDLREAYANLALARLESQPCPGSYAEWLSVQDFTLSSTYWRQELVGFRAPTPLPGPPPDIPFESSDERVSFVEAAHARRVLDVDASGRIFGFAAQHQLSVETLVCGAWALLLSRFSREQEVAFGVSVNCRTGSGKLGENASGPFSRTLPMRVVVNEQLGVLEWLGEMQDRRGELSRHVHAEIEHPLLTDMAPEFGLMSTRVAILTQNLGECVCGLGLNGLGFAEPPDVAYHPALSEPLVLVVRADKSIVLHLEYSRRLLHEASAVQALEQMETILNSLVTSYRARLSAIAWHAETSIERLVPLGLPKRTIAADVLPRMFERWVDRTPEATAVVCGDARVTYRQLDGRANALAVELQRFKLRPGMVVALYATRSVELVVGILAILKAGCAYLPLDPNQPQQRLRLILRDARVAAVVATHAELLAHPPWAEFGDTVRTLAVPGVDVMVSAAPRADTKVNDPAYVIYTSGSTGQPKGVVVTHANASRLFTAAQQLFAFDSTDVWTLFHSHEFDFSVWEIWGALLNGGTLLVVPRSVAREPDAFYEFLLEHEVTVLNQTPSAFRLLDQAADLPVAGHLASKQLRLRYVIFGGEALEFRHVRRWIERRGDASPKLVNMYGITETTVHVTHRLVSKRDLAGREASLIGEPIPDVGLYVLDPQNRLCPIGVPGEIVVSGGGVAEGYLHQEDLTTARFPTLEIEGLPPRRCYRSGDLARRLHNGDIEYLGRIDRQVKIRGFRIELGDIEHALMRHADVREAVVVALDDSGYWGKRLVAYVVCNKAIHDWQKELRGYLCDWLPQHMIPSHFVVLNSIPLTENGKLDVQALPAPGR